MASTQKAIEIRNALKDALSVRLGLTCTESFDTDGNPTLLIGAAAANDAGCFIRVSAESSIQKDILGLSQNVWTPHIVDVAFEGDNSTTTSVFPDQGGNTMSILLQVLAEVVTKGAKSRVWLGPTGTAPTVSTFGTAGYLKATFDSLYYPLMSTS